MLVPLLLCLPVLRKGGPHTSGNHGLGSQPESDLSSQMWPSQAHCKMKKPGIFVVGSLPFHLGGILLKKPTPNCRNSWIMSKKIQFSTNGSFHGAKNPSCLIGIKQFRSIIKRLMVHGSSSTKCFLNLFKLKAFRILLNGSSG